ncbi:MAG: FAD-dependent oxidoreductase, partial [Planctomycetota bacterium]
MSQRDYELVVIGTGPGGEGAAMRAAKTGVRVAAVERYCSVGGGCTHWGTIPSKSLRQQISRIVEVDSASPYSSQKRVAPDYPSIIQTAASVIRRQVRMRETFYERNRVRMIEGSARFVDPYTIEITEAKDRAGATTLHVNADKFIVAVGSRPYRPDDVDFDHPRVFDANTILDRLAFTPRSMTIYGAGVIGCEYASMFRGLHMKVNLVNMRSELLSFLDEEIIHALSYHLRDQGVVIRHNEHYQRVE